MGWNRATTTTWKKNINIFFKLKIINDKENRFKTSNAIFTKGNDAADGRPVMGGDYDG